tara:strand:- start:4102 stop:5373 length:1272 start_codon:yes stop_codon:yes gene_type:complete
MDSTEVPTNFVTVINDFTNDLTTTFPEYSDRWNNLTGTIDDSSRDEIYKYCVKVYPERFFDILYQNADIFSDKQDVNVHFLPNIDFKILYNSEGVTENIRKTIWKYLQLVLFTVVGSVKDKSTFGDSMNMFEGIDEKDLQEKLGETMEGLTDFFKDMGKNESSESEGSSEQEQSMPFNMNGMPNMENMQEHLHTLFNGKIGSLAKEMAEEISGDFTDLLGDNAENASPQDVMKKLMKNPTKIMGLMKSVTGKLDAKMKSGEISREEIMKEAGDLLGKMKESAGGAEMSEMFAKMAKSMGGMGGMGGMGKNMRMDTNAIDRMVKSSKLKEGMLKRQDIKKENMLEKAKQEAILLQQRIDAQDKLIAKYSLEQKDGNNMVFKFDGETSQERSFIHPDLLKELEAEDTTKQNNTNKPKKKKKKGKK